MGLANNMENTFVEGEKRLSGHGGRKILGGKKKEKQRLKNSTLSKITFYEVAQSDFVKKMQKRLLETSINERLFKLTSWNGQKRSQ